MSSGTDKFVLSDSHCEVDHSFMYRLPFPCCCLSVQCLQYQLLSFIVREDKLDFPVMIRTLRVYFLFPLLIPPLRHSRFV